MSNDTESTASVKPVPPIPGFRLGYPEVTPGLAFGADAPSPVKLSEKYRPRTLCDVFGQGSAICQLQGFLDAPHPVAFLFDGPTGTGKTSTALALAAELGVDPNWSLIHIKSGEQDGDAVLNSLRTLRFSAINGGWKMIVVDEADYMSVKAANMWLSALEDLPPRSVIVFTTNHPEKFQDRFLDRCERISFRSGAQDLSLDAETLLRHVWHSETGREDHPALESLPNVVDKHGNVSFRRLLSAIESALRALPRAETPAPSPEPVATPEPIQAEPASKPRTADSIIMDAIGAYRDAVAARGRVNDGFRPVVAIWDALTGGQKSAVTRRLDAIGKDKMHKRGDRLASFAYECSQGSPVTFPTPGPTDPTTAPDDAPEAKPGPFLASRIEAHAASGRKGTLSAPATAPEGWETIEADDAPAPVSGGAPEVATPPVTLVTVSHDIPITLTPVNHILHVKDMVDARIHDDPADAMPVDSAIEGRSRLARVEPDDEGEPARVPLCPVELSDPWVDRFARLNAPMVLECVERARDTTRRDSPLYPWRMLGEDARQQFVSWMDRIGFETGMDCEWTRFDRFLTECLEGSECWMPLPEPTEPKPEGDDDAASVDDQPGHDRGPSPLRDVRRRGAIGMHPGAIAGGPGMGLPLHLGALGTRPDHIRDGGNALAHPQGVRRDRPFADPDEVTDAAPGWPDRPEPLPRVAYTREPARDRSLPPSVDIVSPFAASWDTPEGDDDGRCAERGHDAIPRRGVRRDGDHAGPDPGRDRTPRAGGGQGHQARPLQLSRVPLQGRADRRDPAGHGSDRPGLPARRTDPDYAVTRPAAALPVGSETVRIGARLHSLEASLIPATTYQENHTMSDLAAHGLMPICGGSDEAHEMKVIWEGERYRAVEMPVGTFGWTESTTFDVQMIQPNGLWARCPGYPGHHSPSARQDAIDSAMLWDQRPANYAQEVGRLQNEVIRLEADNRELRRQIGIGDRNRPTPEPAFRCVKCGGSEYFRGSWSASRHQWQHEAFQKKHEACKYPGSLVMQALGFGESKAR